MPERNSLDLMEIKCRTMKKENKGRSGVREMMSASGHLRIKMYFDSVEHVEEERLT